MVYDEIMIALYNMKHVKHRQSEHSDSRANVPITQYCKWHVFHTSWYE